MKIFRIFRRNQRTVIDLQLQQVNCTKNENTKRCYSCGQNLGHYVDEYCSTTTINGIHYLVENRSIIEKIWWAICIMLSLCSGAWLILRSYEKWQNSPVVINFAAKETPIWTLPLPAVTICPYSKVNSSIFNFTDYMNKKEAGVNLTDEEEMKTDYMSLLCPRYFGFGYKSGRFAKETILDFFEEVQTFSNKDMFNCVYGLRGSLKECLDVFYPIITDDGICYTFNLMDRTQMLSDRVIHYKKFHKTKVSDDWSIENGYNKSSGLNTYPHRALVAGVPYGVEINIKVHADFSDYKCGGSEKGFKVHIAHPYSMPRIMQQHFILPYGKVIRSGISPVIMTTSDEVKAYSPERRNCYLSSERPLKYFKVYTQSNCDIECRTNFTLEECGCVNFYMPRENGTRICGPESLKCVLTATLDFVVGDVEKKINPTPDIEDDLNIDCGCLPTCTSMDYDIESTQVTWDWRIEYSESSEINVSDQSLEFCKLQVFFKTDQFVTSERNALYGYPEFVANIGGLLGLFVGFTALSLVEIVYYLTLRILCNIYMFGKGNWSGRTD